MNVKPGATKILITGGCGFIGHHMVEHLIKNTNWHIIIFDKLTYASSGYDRLRDINCFDESRVSVFNHDIINPVPLGVVKEVGNLDYIVHLAAESHVDRSIEDPKPFVLSNVLGTMQILDFVRFYQTNLKKMLYFSTDEVFGPAPEGTAYKEDDRYNSSNPYAASKAGGEELAVAYANTYKVPVMVSHTMNVFGERQHPEKFIPICIRKILGGDMISIHANKERTKAGSRFWIHARNVADAVVFLLSSGSWSEKYNIVGEVEIDNLKMAQTIGDFLGKEAKCVLTDFHGSRPGHDLRYALDGTKLKEMGFEYAKGFEQSLEKTIKWYIDNPKWLELNDA